MAKGSNKLYNPVLNQKPEVNMEKKLVANVQKFLNKCSEIVGKYEQDSFDVNEYFTLIENPIDSPIEQIFRISFQTLTRTNNISEYDNAVSPNNDIYMSGISLIHQVNIGKYRVDFVALYRGSFSDKEKKVIIECDSQQFHDRSERERSYEKQRDRFLQTQGYTVYRFTGSEIIKDSFRCAAEVISFITGYDVKEIEESVINYDPQE